MLVAASNPCRGGKVQHGFVMFCIQVLWQLRPPPALRVTWCERLALIHPTVTTQKVMIHVCIKPPLLRAVLPAINVFQVLYTSGICSKDTAWWIGGCYGFPCIFNRVLHFPVISTHRIILLASLAGCTGTPYQSSCFCVFLHHPWSTAPGTMTQDNYLGLLQRFGGDRGVSACAVLVEVWRCSFSRVLAWFGQSIALI